MSARRRTATHATASSLSPAQHARVKRAHHKYHYTLHQREEAARREARRCICEMDPDLRPDPVVVVPGCSGDQRRDPNRLTEPLQQVYSLLLGMLEVSQRNATNWLLYVARQTGEHADVPGFTMLAALAPTLPLRRGDVVELIAQLHAYGVRHPHAPRQPEKKPVYMDAAGAHMRPACPHSELYRTTRPSDAVLRAYWRTGYWPVEAKRKRRRLVA